MLEMGKWRSVSFSFVQYENTTLKIPEAEKIKDRNKAATARNATGDSRQSCPAGTRVVEPLRMNIKG